jgi:hypothetical protein
LFLENPELIAKKAFLKTKEPADIRAYGLVLQLQHLETETMDV